MAVDQIERAKRVCGTCTVRRERRRKRRAAAPALGDRDAALVGAAH